MDGSKKHVKEPGSVQLRLAWSLSLAVLLVALASLVLALVSAFDEAHEFQDDMLREVAQLVARQPQLAPADEPGADDDRLHIALLSVSGTRTVLGQPPAVNPRLADGLHTIDSNDDAYRVLLRTRADGTRILVAQETAERDDIAEDSAWRTLLPCLLLAPLLPLLVVVLVRRMFRPIARLARDLDGRAVDDLRAVDETCVPREVMPFAVSMNRLLARVAEASAIQRRFVADAAHELRSPLAALSLQAERLGEAEMSALARERLGRLAGGIGRARHLLEQLLAMARVQSTGPVAGAVSLRAACLQVLEAVLPLAEAKDIDIGIVEKAPTEQDYVVALGEADLAAMIRNLVDNAIRYTPRHGRVDLALGRQGKWAVLAVCDSGPGIAPAERERVFDPFYRVPGSEQDGSGLGLAIVRAIANRAGATVTLDDNPGDGLLVTLALPLA